MYLYIYMYVYIYISMYVYKYIYICIYIYMYIYIYVNVYVYMYMYMYIYVCMYVCDPVQPFQTSVPLLCCACIDMIPSVSLSLLGEHHKLKFNITPQAGRAGVVQLESDMAAHPKTLLHSNPWRSQL